MIHIVIPTDLSENAKKACEFGIEIFDSPETSFTLLNTFFIPYVPVGTPVSPKDRAYQNAKKKLDEELVRLQGVFPNLKGKIKLRFEIGDVVNVVKLMEKEIKLSAIVMGTKGASGLAELLVGSRTSTMIEKVSTPVLAIPDSAVIKPIEKIMFATDLELIPDLDELEVLKFLVRKYLGCIEILHITESGEVHSKEHELVESELDRTFSILPHFFAEEKGKDVVSAIEEHLNKNPTDLIAMTTKRGNLFHRIFHKSITKQIAMHTKLPILVMHSDE